MKINHCLVSHRAYVVARRVVFTNETTVTIMLVTFSELKITFPVLFRSSSRWSFLFFAFPSPQFISYLFHISLGLYYAWDTVSLEREEEKGKKVEKDCNYEEDEGDTFCVLRGIDFVFSEFTNIPVDEKIKRARDGGTGMWAEAELSGWQAI